MPQKRRLNIMLKYFLLFGLGLNTISSALANTTSDKNKKKKSVSTLTVKAQEIFDEYSYPARIYAHKQSIVLSDIEGRIEKLLVVLGQKVEKGNALAILKHTDPVYQYKNVKMLAPISGYITKINYSEGMKLARGDKLAEVADLSELKATIEVPVGETKFIKVGQKGEFTFSSNLQGKDVKAVVGTVVGISPIIDWATGTATAEIAIDKSLGHKIALPAPGSYGLYHIRSNLHQAIQIPLQAVGYKGQKAMIGVVVGSKYLRKEISLGDKRDEMVEITSGIKDGEVVVTRASGYVADQEEVEIQ